MALVDWWSFATVAGDFSDLGGKANILYSLQCFSVSIFCVHGMRRKV